MAEVQQAPHKNLTARLSAMMFLEFAVWGCWSVMIAPHMASMGFTGVQIGAVFGTTAFGAIAAPFIGGWIADRFLPAQVYTGIAHLLGAVLLGAAYYQHSFGPLWGILLVYSFCYMPTIATTNGIAFKHMGDSKDFGKVRVFGTIGWIVIQFGTSFVIDMFNKQNPGQSHAGLTLIIAAGVSVVMGLYCFTLPNTPPNKEGSNPLAFLEAFKLTSNRNFLLLLVVSFVVAIELPFYYNLTSQFFIEGRGAALGLGGLGLTEGTTQRALLIGQFGELFSMLLLAPMLLKGGMKWTIFVGILAWPLRYTLFAIGQPTALVIGCQILHGVCYTFFFVGGMIAAERLAHRDIRASAQGLMVFATNGFGMLVGNVISGKVQDFFVTKTAMVKGAMAPVEHNWMLIWAVPIVVTVVAGIAFIALWDEQKYLADAAAIDAAEGA